VDEALTHVISMGAVGSEVPPPVSISNKENAS
jgi:hypothetical protein